MDDIGHNDLGFANPAISTPRIDSLAVEHGLQLTHFYTAKECAPTRGVSIQRLPAAVSVARRLSDRAVGNKLIVYVPSGADDGPHAIVARR